MSRQQRLTLVATILGSTVVFLDSTVVNVALPAIADDLDAGLAGQQWVVEAYMLTLVSLLLVGGSLGDQFGRRRMFVFGLIAFGATSILCALAPNVEFLVGAAGAAGDRRGAAGAGLAGDRRRDLRGAGARQGGRHLDRLDRDRDRARPGRRRRPGRGALLAGDLLGQHPADRGDRGADHALGRGEPRPGGLPRHRLGSASALSAAGLGGPVFALIEQPTHGWGDPMVWLPMIVGIACFALFVVHEARARHPMLDLVAVQDPQLLRSPT